MHICHVCPYNLSVPGGVRTHILDLCVTLRQQGHLVRVIGAYDEVGADANTASSVRTASTAKTANSASMGSTASTAKTVSTASSDRSAKTTIAPAIDSFDIPVERIGKAGGARLPLWGTAIDVIRMTVADKSRMMEFFKRDKVDVLHFHTPWTPVMSWQLIRLVRKLPPDVRPKLVATFHDTPPDSLWGRFLGSFVMPVAARFFMPLFDHVISVSDSQKQYLTKYSDFPVKVIPNGFRFKSPSELDPPLKTEVINPEIQQALDPRKLPQTLLFLSRLEPRKGLIHALRVYRRLLPRHPRLKLLIAGEGKGEAAARRYVNQYNLENVTFLGYVEEAAKQRLYAQADVYLAPALYGESFGIVLLESMAAGTPVAGYGNSGYKDVAEGYAPENFPVPGDVTALAARVDVLLSDPVYRLKVIQKGFNHAKRYDWQTISASVMRVYES
ncbi:MAG: glycosyltransferase family 4 protein [Bacteroidetes bacterium]|nr:glycosyltransferase family 4 protein [Bacteroidota bacterium]MCH8524767.1 glycosyltransferase [Balneolales bacterium]